MSRYCVIGFNAYCDPSNCQYYGFDALVYSEDEHCISPKKSEAIAAIRFVVSKLGIAISKNPYWEVDSAGWWYCGFREYISIDISECPRRAAYELTPEMDSSPWFKLGDTQGDPTIRSSREPVGTVIGRMVPTVYNDEGEPYTAYEFEHYELQVA